MNLLHTKPTLGDQIHPFTRSNFSQQKWQIQSSKRNSIISSKLKQRITYLPLNAIVVVL